MGDTMMALVDLVCSHSLKPSQDEGEVTIVAMEPLVRHRTQAR
jgi:hypothetical protein